LASVAQVVSNDCGNTLAYNEALGLIYSPVKVFNLQLRGHIQRWNGAGFSSSPTLCSLPEHLLVLFIVVVKLTCKVHNMQSIKKPLHLGQGPCFFAHSPHLADCSAGIGTLSCNTASGLPGFIGPFPSTSLDESS
jgi:hypothetical protein